MTADEILSVQHEEQQFGLRSEYGKTLSQWVNSTLYIQSFVFYNIRNRLPYTVTV